jgi:hypothetical protein
MDWTNLNIKAKDVIFIVSFVVTIAISNNNNANNIKNIGDKVDNITKNINSKSDDDKEQYKDMNIWRKAIENSLNTNSLNITLLRQDVEMIKQGYYPSTSNK